MRFSVDIVKIIQHTSKFPVQYLKMKKRSRGPKPVPSRTPTIRRYKKRQQRRKTYADIRTAKAVIRAIGFLQNCGLPGTPENIKHFMRQKTKKCFNNLNVKLPIYLSKAVELGIVKRYRDVYVLQNLKSKRKTRNKLRPEPPNCKFYKHKIRGTRPSINNIQVTGPQDGNQL